MEKRRQKDAKYELAAICAGALLAVFFLWWFFGGVKTQFENMALGAETAPVYARIGKRVIHCKAVTDAKDCVENFRKNDGQTAVLWLGNSQLHGINQYRPGQHPAPWFLYKKLRKQNLDLVAFSEPNANLQEHLVLFAFLKNKLPVKILLLPLIFDDLREDGIRAEIAPALVEASTLASLEKYPIGKSILSRNADPTKGDLGALANTVQETVEKSIDKYLSAHSELWALRPQARGRLLQWLYVLRNTVLGITPQSKRKMIPGRYRMNMEAIKAILEEAKSSGVKVLAYIAPIRNDVSMPYDKSQYDEFIASASELVENQGGVFVNLEGIVPAKNWGSKDATTAGGKAEIDFMHFQEEGHRILAHELEKQVLRMMNGMKP